MNQPMNQQPQQININLKDTDIGSAREWAEDYAYGVSDKGDYLVEEVNGAEDEG